MPRNRFVPEGCHEIAMGHQLLVNCEVRRAARRMTASDELSCTHVRIRAKGRNQIAAVSHIMQAIKGAGRPSLVATELDIMAGPAFTIGAERRNEIIRRNAVESVEELLRPSWYPKALD